MQTARRQLYGNAAISINSHSKTTKIEWDLLQVYSW